MTLTVKVYSSGTTEIRDPSGELTRIQGCTFGTQYPGGLYTDCSFFVPRDIVRSWQVQGAQRVCIYNGLSLVWEGRITNLGYQLEESTQGNLITARGHWAEVLMRRGQGWGKPWADTRIGNDIWVWDTTRNGAEKCSIDRNARLRFTPKAEDWAQYDYAAVTYTAPAGETVKRITFDYDLAEGAQAWRIYAYDPVGAAAIGSTIEASGTGSFDETLATPRQTVLLIYQAMANQTAKADGTYYGEFSNVVIYTETGSINPTEIIKDVAAKDARISTDLSLIGSNTLALVPFVATNEQSLADIIDTAARFGDASYNAWAAGVRGSDQASDGLPIVFYAQYPALTDYEYGVRIDDPNLAAPFYLSQDYDEIYNSITVQYRNAEGAAVKITPDDDANLKDTASIAAYGQSDYLLSVDTTDTTVATNLGRHVLATHKDPRWRVDGEIQIVGYIRGKSRQSIPACEIQAGKRIKIENWLDNISGDGLTFLISTTNYDADSDTCTIGVGNVDRLDTFLARLAHSHELGAI